MTPTETVIHSVVPPGIGRTVLVFDPAANDGHLPMPAIVVQIVEKPIGRERPAIYVMGFPPPDHRYFRSCLRDDPYLFLSAVEGEKNEHGHYWKWPPGVRP